MAEAIKINGIEIELPPGMSIEVLDGGQKIRIVDSGQQAAAPTYIPLPYPVYPSFGLGPLWDYGYRRGTWCGPGYGYADSMIQGQNQAAETGYVAELHKIQR